MDPEFASAIAAAAANAHPFSGPPTIEQIREFFNQTVSKPAQQYHAERLPPDISYTVVTKDIHEHCFVRCVVPVVPSEETFPVLVNMHSGCGCVGDTNLDDSFLRRLSVELKMVTVNIEYRRAPEHPFPAGIDDCYAALKWVAEQAPPILKADLSKGFLLGGHSAGANFAAVLAHLARDDSFFEGRRLTGQLLREPFVAHPDCHPESLKDQFKASEENKNNPPLDRATLVALFQLYAAPMTDPRFAPIMFTSHEGLPPAYIQVAGLDSLRDDGIVYEKVLSAAGVPTKIELYPGVGHGFHYNFPEITLAEKAREDVVAGLKWLLGRP